MLLIKVGTAESAVSSLLHCGPHIPEREATSFLSTWVLDLAMRGRAGVGSAESSFRAEIVPPGA